MIHETKIAYEVMEMISSLDLECAIVGGYPRDLANGRTPKDMDIVIYNFDPSNAQEASNLTDLVKYFHNERLLLPNGHSSGNMSSGQGCDWIYMCMKLKGDIDVIVYTKEFKTVKDVLYNFDFNMNMYQLQHGTPVFVGYAEGTLVENKLAYRKEGRNQRMYDIAKELNWFVSDATEERMEVIPSAPFI